MNNIYDFRLQRILKTTTSSVSQLAESRLMNQCAGMVRSALCHLVAVLLLSVGTFSYAQADTWDGTYSTSWSAAGITGAGTAANPYIIDKAHKFATLGYMTQLNNNNTLNKYFRLDADIDLDGTNREWTFGMSNPNCFRGHFDGNGHTISNVKMVARSSQETGSYNGRYGLFSGLQGNNANQTASIKNLILNDVELVVESAGTTGERSGERYYGILVGKVHGYCTIENIKVNNPKITLRCNQATKWNVGTIACINGWSHAKNILVTNPKFKDDGSEHTFLTQTGNNTNNRFSVGGVVGFISDDSRGTGVATATDGTKVLQANYITDCAVVNADFNFANYSHSLDNSFQYNNFSVAGVVGSHWYPIRMCENLFFSGKIKAPGAFVVPCVYIGMSNAWNKTVDYYDGEQMNDADRVEKSRSATWYYGEYKIGLSDELADAKATGHLGTEGEADCVYFNFAAGAVDGNNYVTVNPTTLKRTNRNNATARPSRTLLWWTGSYYDGSKRGYLRQWDSKKPFDTWDPSKDSDWHDGEQVIYPEINQTVGVNGIGNYPAYYMFYAQGVNMHTKYMNTSAAKSFVAGLKGNIETAMGTASKKVTLTIGERVAGEEIDEENRPTVRGYVDHNFTITPGGANASDATSYIWYVDGEETGSGTSLSSVKPNFVYNQGWQSGKGITVVAFGDASDTLAVATTYIPIYRLRVKDQESCTTKVDAGFRTYTYDLGTQSHPYLIGSENDLRLMQEQMLYECNTSNEHVYLTGINNGNRCTIRSQMSNATTSNSPSYQQSYYEMDGNVTLNTSIPFYPIGPATAPIYSGDGSSGAYRESAAFVGEFDGKGYTISGVRQEWHAGYSGNGTYNLWGLFSQISRENKYIKIGETTATNAVVRNLIINDIKLTHRTSNTSFYYNNGKGYYDANTWRDDGATNWGSHCYIGTLAALVGANATIENIAVTDALITDTLAGAAAYDLAQKQLFVGGLIGVLRKQLTKDDGTLANTVIRYVSSDADINLQYPKFRTPGNGWEQLNFLVGGLVGRLYSNAADNTLPYPRPSIFTGKIRSYVNPVDADHQRAGAMAGPIFAYSAYSGNNATNWADFPKHFLGKTVNTAAFDATGMFYHYQHYDNQGTAGYKDITDTYPPVATDWGDRNLKRVTSHVSNNVYTGTGTGTTDYDLLEYQGVNQGIYASEQDPVVTSAFNDQSTLTEAEQEPIKDYKWTWSRNTASRPVVTIGEVSGMYVTAKDTYNGDDVTDHVIEATVNSASTGERTYQWYKKMRTETSPGVWKNDTIAIDGATAATYTATPSVHNQYIMVRATINGESAYSEPVIVSKNQNIVATISKEAGESPVKWVMHANVSTDYATPMDSTALKAENFVISYQWYKGMVGSGIKLDGETHDYLNVESEETSIRYCIITVTDMKAHSDYTAANTYTLTVSMLPANTMVVFLDPSGSGDDRRDGLSPATAVKSWHKAYSLLRENVTWDDNIIVLMSASDRARTSEGFYSNSSTAQKSWSKWYTAYHDNATMLRTEPFNNSVNGTARINEPARFDMSHYTPGYDGWTNGDLWKNVTITGKYGAYDYSSTGTNTAIFYTPGGNDDNMMIFGDTRFKNLTFYGGSGGNGGHHYDILYCYYNSLEMGDSLVFVNQAYPNRGNSARLGLIDNAWGGDFQIFGGPCNDGRFRDASYGYDNALMESHMPHNGKGFEINIKSGFYSVICSSYRQNDGSNGIGGTSSNSNAGIVGTPNMPVKCTINIDINTKWNIEHDKIYSIDGNGTAGNGAGTNSGNASWSTNRMTYDIGSVLAGNHEGSMYGDVSINLYSGRISRVAAGNLGAIRDYTPKSEAYFIPLNNFMGRCATLLDPAKSRFATEGMEKSVRDTLLVVTEVYGGGLGRAHGADGMVNIPFYGHSSITVNGGTIKLLQKDNTVTNDANPGIYATGAGGVNGMYHVNETLARYRDAEGKLNVAGGMTQRLPYWKTDKEENVTLYGDWNTYNTNRGAKHVSVKCYNADTDDYTDIDLEDTQTTMVINDGVFGSESAPLQGIFGGGSGYTPTGVMADGNSTFPSYRSGNIYGKKDADHPVVSLTINGGEFYCPIYGGGRGTEHYYQTKRNNSGSGSNNAWYGNYTALGQIYGDVELNITGGTFHDNVYGGGKGFGTIRYDSDSSTKKTLKDMARIYGTSTVNITGGTFDGSIYGGGAIAKVGYGGSDNARMTPEIAYYGTKNKNAVTMNITDAVIKGKVFASAQGLYEGETIGSRVSNVDHYTTFETIDQDSVGIIYGNVSLAIENSAVGSDIYAGAEKGDVYGNTVTTINNTQIGGDIYGGGMGVVNGSPATVKASADIKGNTTITLGAGSYFIDEDFEADYSTPHYVYGGGNLASIIGLYDDSTDPASITSATSGGNTTVNINNGVGTGQLSVFGAGYGANTYVNMTNVNINNFQTLRTDSVYNESTEQYDKTNHVVGLNVVYGGGNEGTVFTSTNVGMKGGLVLGNVFGGGNEAPVGTLIPYAQITAHDYAPYGTMVSLASTDANIYGNIYGGGNKDIVKGISQVSVSAGSFAGEVFGGGKGELSSNDVVGNSADVIGQTAVFVNGAHVIWDRFWDEATSSFIVWDGVTTTGATAEKFITMDGSTPVFKKNHNIYGGGELACVVTDTARVQVTNGAVPSALIKKTVWKNAFNDDANPHFYVFGGGYGAFTQAKSTDVTVGVEGYFSDDEDESTSEQWALNIPLEGENTITATNDDTTIGIYGNNYGIGGYTVLGVIGGGYAGLVKEDTNVKLGGTTFVHRVYGGGYGQLAAYNDLASDTRLDNQTNQTNSIIESSRTREQLGEVGGNTHVTVSLSKPDEKGRTGGVYGDVFGGGAGVESTKSGGNYTDYQYMGQVLGVTRVDITENARVYGNVYGGGDVANVTNTSYADSTTVVKLRGGDVFGDVFGGGKGRLATEADDYTVLGNIFGNSNVIVNDSIKTETIDEVEQTVTVSPNIWGNIYGGGQVGDIKKTTEPTPRYGNTSISINGGNVGGDVYGAGLGDLGELDSLDVLSESKSEYDFDNRSSADVEGNTNMVINGGSFLWKQAAETDGNIKTLVEAQIDRETALAIIAARKDSIDSPELLALQENFADIFDYKNNQFIRDHNIYGGGNSASLVSGSSTITVNHGMLNDDVAYFDDKNWNLSSLLTQLVTDNNSHPQFSVFGGGYGIKTTITGNATVNVQVGKDIDGDGDTDNDDYTSQTLDRATWTSLYAKFTTDYAAVPEATKDALYGGSGANGQFRYNTSRLANCFSIPNHTFMDIVGGGMAGLVNGSTQVNVSDQSMCQNIIGGGIGIEPADVEVTRSGKKTERLTPTGYETFGKVGGSSTVNITGAIVAGNVYGGGAGVESVDTDKDNTPDIDFTKIGAVGKTTSVTIDGTPDGTIIFGKVYGGGDIADVKNNTDPKADFASTVTIQGGCVYQQVFAGGSGRLASECGDYRRLGKIFGNTKVTIQDGTSSPWLWNRVYGGGSYGSVDGTTNVVISGGHLGYNIFGAGLGDVRTVNGVESKTSSDVTGDTYVTISGGEFCLSQMWDIDTKNWVAATKGYSSQYDYENNKFRINHNIYGGGNAVSAVAGNTHITMTKGLLKGATALGHDDTDENGDPLRDATSLFASNEWKNIYNKEGSFHFSVIGGGYGENTSVGTTNVNLNLAGNKELRASDSEEDGVLKKDLSTAFASEQSVLDVIGGGYNGVVNGTTNVTIEGDTYLRRVFGGSFYADVAKTNVLIRSANVDDVIAGGMMGDITSTAADAVTLNLGEAEADANNKIFVNNDVYGGNDVSGQIDGHINVNIHGGKIYHNVYGAGNGNYLYTLNEDRKKVTTVEDYEADGTTYPLVYEVPRRPELIPASAESASEAARLVNINSYRPLSQYINLNVTGSSTTPVTILGKLFGGGNTATVTQLDGNKPEVTVNIGDHVTVNEVFMGSDGEAMFNEGANGFLNAFIRLNKIQLSNGINWSNDPSNKTIPEKYLPLSLDERQKTFKHIVDLYFQPVEMSIQPVLKWNNEIASTSWSDTEINARNMTGTTIGSFFCGGNRGNMDATPNAAGNAVDYIFPKGLTIKDKIVGGCNNANFIKEELNVVHEGGYLLGTRATAEPMIKLKVAEGCNIKPYSVGDTYAGGNIYGGCYSSGTINGDIHIDAHVNMVDGLSVDKLNDTDEAGVSAGCIYGAGYGTDSYVYGNIEVAFGTSATASTQNTTTANAPLSLNVPLEGAAGNKTTDDPVVYDKTYVDTGFSANSIYGGGERGKVIGNTTVKILNGHVAGDVCGGSYAGVQYGSTHVFVGYPEYYKVSAGKSDRYLLKRADKREDNLALTNFDKSKAIKDTISLIAGDLISPVVYDAIKDYDAANGTNQQANLEALSVRTPAAWSNISILIDGGVYGGGYELSSGYTGSGGAGSYTVKRYTADYNVDNSNAITNADRLYGLPTYTTSAAKGYGGNTTVLVWDDPTLAKEHITIAAETSEGGLYGDGHLSYSEGFRAGELKGYGYAEHSVLDADKYNEMVDDGNGDKKQAKAEVNNAKVMNTIQRLDMMRLTDNCLLLNGARDYTIKEVSTTPYSIARVGELQMVSSIDTTATTPFPIVPKARNYVGLMNNIHYVGAVKSDVDFDRKFHKYDGSVPNDSTYRQKKYKFITDFYTAYPKGQKSATEIKELSTSDENGVNQQAVYNSALNRFNLRNDATALNMIGLSSGYALKVQGTREIDNVGTEELYYGPVDGVIEVKLIQPILDEGGGYVYADNVHDKVNEFMESTGNFVFPTSLLGAQKVVDDCLLTKFDQLPGEHGDDTKNAEKSEMHYWFLTGSHYFYNLHITGYTYDSKGYLDYQYVAGDIKGIKFNADTSDGLTILEGANSDLYITGIKWLGHHNVDGTPSDYDSECDLQKTTKDYTLRLSASNTTRNDEKGNAYTYTYYNQDAGTSLYYTISQEGEEGHKELDNGEKSPDTKVTDPETNEEKTVDNPNYVKWPLHWTGENDETPATKPSIASPLLAIQLVDNVNNASDNGENKTSSEYYAAHLSKPDTLQIELRSKPEAWNTYTINLIINYVKGPSYTDNISIGNCALPGEYIKINKGVKIDSDESFAQNGEFLRIGKLNAAKNGFENGYLTYDASGETTSEILKGKVYSDKEGKYLMVPAYYFMNGYGVQYVFTCNNMDNIEFPVKIDPDNTMLVHNYHEMDPHPATNNYVDLHLAEAVTRAEQEPTTFAQPRIYIRDVKDMQAFQQFIDTVGVTIPKVKLTGYADSLLVPKAGQYAQFYLQDNITVQQTEPLADSYYPAVKSFAGTWNGDGYAINGITGNLFGELTATGQVYNLGLPSGTIAGKNEKGGKIRTSYEYENLKVYNLDGNAETYTAADFNDGKVAYNLNQYYLEARKYVKSEEKAGRTTPTSSAIADQTALKYVADYYANGDYQYARQYNENTGAEYLRTDAVPHYTVDVQTDYSNYESYHKYKTHDVDVSRAVDVEEQGNYRPLFSAAKIDAASTATAEKSDYIFFGQGLQAVPEEYPSVIASHTVDDMSNRVYRASGFYQSKLDQGFHFNANRSKDIDTYVHNPKTTAIDFTGERDKQNTALLPREGWITPETSGIVGAQQIFYAPAVDMPGDSHAFIINEDVTKNLLVYTDNETAAGYSMAELVQARIGYNDNTDEDDILGHRVIVTGDPATYNAARLHLVDMEDFNAPIQFTADSAWYIRDPQAETGYVNEAGRGWTSISLPFTVKNATLSEGLTRYKDAFNNGQTGSQTSITYFYGATDNPSDVNVRKRTVLGHEFWFRALNSSKDVAGDKAYFKRPLYGIDGRSEASDAANAANRSFEAYKPYIVSFPGEQFYEFDMTGQTIAFAADDAVIAVTDDNVTANRAASNNSYYYYGAYLNNDGKDGAYAIDVNGTGDRFDNGQHIYPFRGYLTTGAEIKGNSMNLAFTGDTSNRYILIGDDLGKLEEVLDGDIDRDPDGGVSTDSGLRVYGVGQRIVVVSDYATTLPVYTATGALVRVLDVRPGTATYSGFKQGIYVVDQKKIRLR